MSLFRFGFISVFDANAILPTKKKIGKKPLSITILNRDF